MNQTTEAEIEARRRDRELEEAGVLEPGESTETAHNDHVRAMRAEFTPEERAIIRDQLWGGPLGGHKTGSIR